MFELSTAVDGAATTTFRDHSRPPYGCGRATSRAAGVVSVSHAWSGDRQQARRKEAMVSRRVARAFAAPPLPLAPWPTDTPITSAAYQRGGVTTQWTETDAETAGAFLRRAGNPMQSA